ELGTDQASGARDALAEDAVAVAVLPAADPDDDEPSAAGGDLREALIARRVRADPELPARARARGVVTLTVDAPARAVLCVALPDVEEAAVALVHRDGRALLISDREGVGAKRRADGRERGVDALPDDGVAGEVLQGALPDDDEIAGVVDVDGGQRLI